METLTDSTFGSNLKYRIAFSMLRGINPTIASEILARVGSEETFFNTPARTIAPLMGFDSKLFDDELRAETLNRAIQEVRFVTRSSIRPIYFTSPEYPVRLLQCEDAPIMLYVLGDGDINATHLISIVGTRHATPYGIEFVDRTIRHFADNLASPVTIVSGLAYGIDITAHKAALRAGLPTAAVLAHGLNTIYPAEHRSIAAEIIQAGGMLITEYPSQSPIHKGNFLARNRIVAGISDCILVAESARKGGALVTARIAAEYSRDVFALPGRISDAYSAGCNDLISSCVAALVTGPADIIAAMHWEEKPTQPVQQTIFPQLNEIEQAIVDYLNNHGEARLAQLQSTIPISVGRLMATLIDLEMRHIILAFPGGLYRPA